MPAYNEQEALPAVLAELRTAVPDVDVLVVSDGSTDGTATVARAAGVLVLELPLNLGVGGAMRAGFRFAARHGYQVAVQVDGDGQHDPREIPTVLAALDEADVVIGARFAGRGDYVARGPRRWAMTMLARTLSRVAGTSLTDTTSGFRAANRRAIELFAANYPAEYLGDTVESLVIACRAGLRVRQVPVVMRVRAGGAPSQASWRAAVFLARALLATAIALSRPMSPAGAR